MLLYFLFINNKRDTHYISEQNEQEPKMIWIYID